MEIQKFDYLKNEKSFLDVIKSIVHIFWRTIIWWKNKNLIKTGDTNFNIYIHIHIYIYIYIYIYICLFYICFIFYIYMFVFVCSYWAIGVHLQYIAFLTIKIKRYLHHNMHPPFCRGRGRGGLSLLPNFQKRGCWQGFNFQRGAAKKEGGWLFSGRRGCNFLDKKK